ncbi:DUF7519 family protein [Halopelagius fulvigenes]|uniref:Uncharacterized protein n=1 Tax=Halopelagius fulvigenes TaxID=1198324 RepID=A0ABD5U774_9EURY
MTYLSYPTRVGSAASLAAAVGAVLLVLPDGAGSMLSLGAAFVLVLLGALAARAAANVRGDGSRSLGAVLLAVGAGLTVGGVGVGVLGAETLPNRLIVAAGLLGVCLLGAGLAPVPRVRPRRLVSAGSGALVVCVLLTGLMTGVEALQMLAATAATVVAWDAGENAVSLGEHVGRRARAWPVELGHSGATAAYGAAVVVAAFGVSELNVTDVPLVGLLLLLGGAVALLLALSN